MTEGIPWETSVQQRLRRLRLIDDGGRSLDVESILSDDQRADPFARPAARSILRMWAAAPSPNALPLAVHVLALDHMRGDPIEACGLLSNAGRGDFASELAMCALHIARRLYDVGRTAFVDGDIDKSMNYFRESQQELLFAVTSGKLSEPQVTEAKGRYAVAVVFAARWLRTPAHILQRALRYLRESIEGGNTAPEAWTYLIELLVEVFNSVGEREHLEEALRLARHHDAQLALAEILLKVELLDTVPGSAMDQETLRAVLDLAESYRCTSGTDYVRVELLRQFAAALRRLPLTPREIRLPFGLLLDMPRLSAAQMGALIDIVVDPLADLQKPLRDARRSPNVVALQVVASLLSAAVSREELCTPDLTRQLLSVTSEAAAVLPENQHLQWRYAEALLAHANATRSQRDLSEAFATCDRLTHRYPGWPLPWVTVARARAFADDPEDSANGETPDAAWRVATELVAASAEYRRADLGGRSGVFAVEDARGDLSTALVFKPVDTLDLGLQERDNMRLLLDAIEGDGTKDRFAVPASLAVVDAEGVGPVHVMERQVGRVLSSIPRDEAATYLSECSYLLGLYHRVAPRPPASARGRKAVRRSLVPVARMLFGTLHSNDFIERFRECLPRDLPVVAKRDSHAGNWVVDSAERVIAIDLQGSVPVPVGYDIAQLVEDAALLPASEAGFERRYELAEAYARVAEIDMDSEKLRHAYDWFALHRAVRLAASSSATKAEHRHARQLASHISKWTTLEELREPAAAVARATRVIVDRADREGLTRAQIRLSKALARVLRHQAPRLGLHVDDGGFTDIAELAAILKTRVEDVIAVATHPSEPRFGADERRIRALYGHSFPIAELNEIDVDLPATLYHGTSWASLNAIVADGLRSMERQHVHLTNNPTEAIQVARRHGLAVLVSVDTSLVTGLRAVADAVWAVDGVTPRALHISNVFTEIPVPPEWLAASV